MQDNQSRDRRRSGKMRLTGFIFDFDGTLADTMPLVMTSFRRALALNLKRPWTDADFTSLFGLTEAGILKALSPERWEECFRTYLAAYDEGHQTMVRRLPEIEEAVRLLRRRGARTAVVTGKDPLSMDLSLRHLALAGVFDAVETGSPERPCKPEAIQRVLSGWSANPGRVVYLGDTAYDMKAAREAGIIPLGAAWATDERHALQAARPARIFDEAGEFLRWCQEEVEILGSSARP